METTKLKLLAKGIVTDTISRYIVPLTASDKERQFVKGDTIKIYGICDAEVASKHIGKEMVIVSFKRNTSRIIKSWCIPAEELRNNFSLIKK
jgi:hypothetical protein